MEKTEEECLTSETDDSCKSKTTKLINVQNKSAESRVFN